MRTEIALRIRWELLHVCIATFEATWVYAWVEAFHAPEHAHIGFGALWFYALVLYTLSRFVVVQETWSDRRRWLVLGGTAIGLALLLIQVTIASSYGILGNGILGIRDMYSIFISPISLLLGVVNPLTTAGLAFWLIWFRLVHTTEFLATSYRFRLGVLFLFGALIVDTASPSVGMWVPVFYFFSGLLAIALARAEDVSSLTQGETLPFTRQWLLTLLVGVTGMFAGASLLMFFVSDEGIAWLYENFPQVAHATRWVLAQFVNLMYYLAAFVMWLVSPLIEWLRNMFQNMENPQFWQPQPPPTPVPDETQSIVLDNKWLRQLLALLDILKIVVPSMIMAFLFWLGFEMTQREESAEAAIQAQFSDAPTDEIGQDDRSWLGTWRDRVQRFLQRRTHSYGTDTVRDLYANLLILGEEMGYPRHPEQTPLEYWAQLRIIWPSLDKAIWNLTNTYIQTRYGHEPVDEETLDDLRNTWKTIRETALTIAHNSKNIKTFPPKAPMRQKNH
nr:DUF4129 domain-containing protein [Ardenticatena sp.]